MAWILISGSLLAQTAPTTMFWTIIWSEGCWSQVCHVPFIPAPFWLVLSLYAAGFSHWLYSFLKLGISFYFLCGVWELICIYMLPLGAITNNLMGNRLPSLHHVHNIFQTSDVTWGVIMTKMQNEKIKQHIYIVICTDFPRIFTSLTSFVIKTEFWHLPLTKPSNSRFRPASLGWLLSAWGAFSTFSSCI